MDKIALALIVMSLGAAGFVTASYVIPGGLGYIYNQNLKLITACEKELPRNQKCKLIAVPEKNNAP